MLGIRDWPMALKGLNFDKFLKGLVSIWNNNTVLCRQWWVMGSRQQFQPGQKPVYKTGIMFRHWEWVKLCCIMSLQQLIAHTLKRYWKIIFESVLFLFLAIKRLTILDLLKALGSLTLAIIALNGCLKPSIHLSSSMFW